MSPRPPESYEAVVLGVLHGEFPHTARADTDAAIARVLKRKKLGAFDPDRIARLRAFKDEIQHEVGIRPLPTPAAPQESRYYVGRHGYYGDYADFDLPRWTTQLCLRHPDLPDGLIAWFVHYAVGTWYLL